MVPPRCRRVRGRGPLARRHGERPALGADTGSRAGLLLDSAADMRPLAALERFFERLFERQSARLFHDGDPAGPAAAPGRAGDGGRAGPRRRPHVVPHRFVVQLHGRRPGALRRRLRSPPRSPTALGRRGARVRPRLLALPSVDRRHRGRRARSAAARPRERPRAAEAMPRVDAERPSAGRDGPPARRPRRAASSAAIPVGRARRQMDQTASGTGSRRSASRDPAGPLEPLDVRRATADDRAGARQRPRPPRWPGVPPPRPARWPPRRAVYRRSRQHERLAVNGVEVDEVVLGAGTGSRLGDTVARRSSRSAAAEAG